MELLELPDSEESSLLFAVLRDRYRGSASANVPDQSTEPLSGFADANGFMGARHLVQRVCTELRLLRQPLVAGQASNLARRCFGRKGQDSAGFANKRRSSAHAVSP